MLDEATLPTKRSVVVSGRHNSRSKSVCVRKSSRKSQAASHFGTAGHIIVDLGPSKVTFQPTYRLEPQRPISLETIEKTLERTMRMALTNQAVETYSSSRANRFCQSLSREIMLNFRAQDFDRFRVICVVSMVEKNNQSMQLKMGFVWDSEWDQWTYHMIEMKTFFLEAYIFCVYFEWYTEFGGRADTENRCEVVFM